METVSDVVHLLAHRRDPRVRGHVMQSSTTGVGLALLGYLLLVGYGPRFMKNRSTPPLRLVMTLYNIGQVCLSSYLMREFWQSGTEEWLCQPVDVSDDPRSLRLATAYSLFLCSKALDMLDTVFLVMKKDHHRLSFFHVFHHASMLWSCAFAAIFAPGGASWLPAAFHCAVHCIMYSYYLLASLGPRVRPYLWWKRYLTQLQLLHFAGIAGYSVLMQTPGFRCGLPLWTCAMPGMYLVIMLAWLPLVLGMRAASRASSRAGTFRTAQAWSIVRQQLREVFARHGFGCVVDQTALYTDKET